MHFFIGVCYEYGPTVDDGGAVVATVVERCEGEDETVDMGRGDADGHTGK